VRLDAILARLVKGLALVGALVWPVMPKTGEEMWLRLGLDPQSMTHDRTIISKLLTHQRPIVAGSAFFPRLEGEDSKKSSKISQESQEAEKPKLPDGLISIEEFKRLDLRVAEILSAEKLKKSTKLVKLKLSLGDSERVIVAGIGTHFQPEELVGRQVIIIANLAPAKLMGVESKGMVLAASNDTELVLLTVSSKIAPGSKVS
jgi:methionyl-tRNA synthetase